MHIILTILLTLFPVNLWADKATPHPVFEKSVAEFKLSKDLNSISTDDLVAMKDKYIDRLKYYQKIADKKKLNHKKLLYALREYDVERSKIVNVIYRLIDLYKVDEETAKKMSTYAERFTKIHEEHIGQLGNLKDYKSYDFQLGITYASFLQMIRKIPSLHQRLEVDMDNPSTVIGQYIKDLEKSNQVVEQASSDIEEIHIIHQIETSIKRLDQELINRI